jgi:hypothetical protein
MALSEYHFTYCPQTRKKMADYEKNRRRVFRLVELAVEGNIAASR